MTNTTTQTNRVECRIHGGWWHMPLIRVQGTSAIVRNLNDTELSLPIVDRQAMRWHENAASAQDVAEALAS